MREMGTRDRVMGDCDIKYPNDNKSNEEQEDNTT